jgi:hypothetical protein
VDLLSPPGDVQHSAGASKLPEIGEIWGGVVEDMDSWWESLVEGV